MVYYETQINTYTDDDQRNPSVTGLTDGGFLVTWNSRGQDGSYDGIFGQRYDSSGNTAGSEFQINTYTDIQQYSQSVTGLNLVCKAFSCALVGHRLGKEYAGNVAH